MNENGKTYISGPICVLIMFLLLMEQIWTMEGSSGEKIGASIFTILVGIIFGVLSYLKKGMAIGVGVFSSLLLVGGGVTWLLSSLQIESPIVLDLSREINVVEIPEDGSPLGEYMNSLLGLSWTWFGLLLVNYWLVLAFGYGLFQYLNIKAIEKLKISFTIPLELVSFVVFAFVITMTVWPTTDMNLEIKKAAFRTILVTGVTAAFWESWIQWIQIKAAGLHTRGEAYVPDEGEIEDFSAKEKGKAVLGTLLMVLSYPIAAGTFFLMFDRSIVSLLLLSDALLSGIPLQWFIELALASSYIGMTLPPTIKFLLRLIKIRGISLFMRLMIWIGTHRTR